MSESAATSDAPIDLLARPSPNIGKHISTSKVDIYQLIATAAGLWLGPPGVQTTHIKPGPGVPVAEYILPSKETILDLQDLFTVLHAALDVNTSVLLAVNKLNMSIVRSIEDHNLVFVSPHDFKKVHVSFMWRFGEADNMIIEDPHQGIDGVQYSSPCIFLNTKQSVNGV